MLVGESMKVVDQRLKELDVQNLASRKVIIERSIAVSYVITYFGCLVLNILENSKIGLKYMTFK